MENSNLMGFKNRFLFATMYNFERLGLHYYNTIHRIQWRSITQDDGINNNAEKFIQLSIRV